MHEHFHETRRTVRRLHHDANVIINRNNLPNNGTRLDQNVNKSSTIPHRVSRLYRLNTINRGNRLLNEVTYQKTSNLSRHATKRATQRGHRCVQTRPLNTRNRNNLTRHLFRRHHRKSLLFILVRRSTRRVLSPSIHHVTRRGNNPLLPRINFRELTRPRRANKTILRLRDGTSTQRAKGRPRSKFLRPNGTTRNHTHTLNGVMNRRATTSRHKHTRPRPTRREARRLKQPLKMSNRLTTTTNGRLRRVTIRLKRTTLYVRGGIIRVTRSRHVFSKVTRSLFPPIH